MSNDPEFDLCMAPPPRRNYYIALTENAENPYGKLTPLTLYPVEEIVKGVCCESRFEPYPFLVRERDENEYYDVTPPEEFYRSATFSYRNRRHLNGRD